MSDNFARKERPNVYSILVVTYLFLGGAAGGAFLIMSAWSLYFHRTHAYRKSNRVRQSFRIMKRTCYPCALILLSVALACLFFDLGVPRNAYLFFLRPHFTPITFGAFSLAALWIVGAALSIANVFRPRRINGYAKAGLEAVCALCALCVMAYTGVYLYSQTAVPAWHTPWLIALFVFSSASAGISVVLLVDYFIQGKTLLLRTVRPLQKAHLICLACEAISIAALAAYLFTTDGAARSLEKLLNPSLAQTALIGAMGLGIVAPAILESWALANKGQRSIPFSDVICLIGCFCIRWVVVMCGAH